MKSRFLKRVYYDKFNFNKEIAYGDTIGNYFLVVHKDCGNVSKIEHVYVYDIKELTPYVDSYGNPICYNDIVILNFREDKQILAEVYFDTHFGTIKLRSLGGFIDLDHLGSWMQYTKNSSRTIKVKLIDDYEKLSHKND